jgi:plastocyanin
MIKRPLIIIVFGFALVNVAQAGDKPHPPTTQVSIDNFTFSPPTLTVAPGTIVTWINHDDVPHTVTSNTKPRALDSKTLDTDDKFSFTFISAGTYDYFCAVHPHMTGKVIVKQGAP